MLEKFFNLREYGTNVRTELLAGLTTFLTMAYILAVNPDILGAAGMDTGAVFTATAVSSAIATLVMALVAKLPFALAPGMGLNAFFAFGVVQGMGYSWQFALTAVFLEGLLFLFFAPLFLMVPAAATAPALVIVGFFMMSPLLKVDFSRVELAFPAFVTLIMMPLTYSIAHGIIFGMLTHVTVHLLTGKWRQLSWFSIVLCILFALKLGLE